MVIIHLMKLALNPVLFYGTNILASNLGVLYEVRVDYVVIGLMVVRANRSVVLVRPPCCVSTMPCAEVQLLVVSRRTLVVSRRTLLVRFCPAKVMTRWTEVYSVVVWPSSVAGPRQIMLRLFVASIHGVVRSCCSSNMVTRLVVGYLLLFRPACRLWPGITLRLSVMCWKRGPLVRIGGSRVITKRSNPMMVNVTRHSRVWSSRFISRIFNISSLIIVQERSGDTLLYVIIAIITGNYVNRLHLRKIMVGTVIILIIGIH